MHRPPPSSRRRSSYAPQLCAAGAFLLLLLLSLTILHLRLSSNHSSIPIPDNRIQTPDILTDDQPLPENPEPQTLFWDHLLSVSRIPFSRPDPSPAFSDDDFPQPDLAFASDDQPIDETVKEKLAKVRRIEDVLLLENSMLREGWAKWLEGKGDFIRRDRMLRLANCDALNPRNHLLLQDPDVAGSMGMSRGDRVMRKMILKEMAT